MKGKIAIIASVFVFVIAIFGYAAFADSDSLTPIITFSNIEPVFVNATLDDTTLDPTEASTTTLTVTFYATDENGISDFDDSVARIDVDDANDYAASWKGSTSCTPTDYGADTVKYVCTINMNYYDASRTSSDAYTVQVTYGDYAGTHVQTLDAPAGNELNFTYSELLASQNSLSGLTWTTPVLGTSDVAADENPMVVNNTGNVLALGVNVTGAGIAYSSGGEGDEPAIGVGQFSVDDVNNAASEQALTTSTQQITDISVSRGAAGGNSDNVYFFFDVPSNVRPATYSTNNAWTITTYAS